ncbi:class F sortase [Nocardioides marmoriginsengisoli]|uniref:Class F sortase n=1 Tax=Nocardioides marmoriginsengisoli TaxID=661483 RepID=A0A3N0CL19_9ACTN|nr:sortase [Nocardioides marmoriginsengisoli]RNL64155.1 class F sortase [Nocardioides marmoriginsengisoli]
MKHLLRTIVLAAACGIALTGCGSETPAAPVPAAVASPAAPAPAVAPSARPAPRQVGRPTRVLIGKIKVDEALHGVGLKQDGAMQTPDFGDAGWYDLGPRPGARGPAVIVAHVHGPAGDDVFADLHRLVPGDRVTVRRTDGASVFVVDSVEQSKKEALPAQRIWKRSDQALLRLITCGGKPDPVTRMYPENTVVYAHLAS